MNVLSKRIVILILTLSMAAGLRAECTSDNSNKEIAGTLLGAAVGGLIGSQIGGGTGNKVAIGAGVLAGGLIGNRIGRSLDCQDLAYHERTTHDSLEYQRTGEASTWRNPDTGHSGTIIPTKTYMADNETPCREFTQIIRTGEGVEEVTGTACRQSDGTWKIVDG
jgi:surface antigen